MSGLGLQIGLDQEGWYRGHSRSSLHWQPCSRPRRNTVSNYRPVPPQIDLPDLEHGVLEFWRENDIFNRSLERNQGASTWTFYEGPPTANGRPGTHHVESRTFKDIFPRFKTMQGYQVNRKGGWDCHGLPVELAVEKELGFSGHRGLRNR